ncbi:unnamed protein product [Rotaria sp. Silwood1]|nr:unnamed protein product [Rotaria sp. Silwood1]CAF0896599.1 unnamed protein product [Rotaria sp. Silwood1]CAF0910471.1 unnamed protein product [Rotaria sp. Silwood1]CAF3352719.1 unnamed protein product [Rotaria sp. Silwood1]CAF3376066.1 unnamed protein product [Rotaria sp. Silwood1]
MNKVKPYVLLLCSFIGIDNNRFEQLALDKCQAIDLTLDYIQSPYESHFERFYLYVLPRIIDKIQSLTLYIEHVPKIISFVEKNCGGILPNLTHLRIMLCMRKPKTGTPFTLGNGIYSIYRDCPLHSIVPQFCQLNPTISSQILSSFDSSPFMGSIVSIEVDDGCMLSNIFYDHELFFPQTNQLTHIQITLCYFNDCICLLTQLGTQLCSFSVSIIYFSSFGKCLIYKIPSILCPNIKHLTMRIYRNFDPYKECLVPLLQRFSNVEYLTLLLAIDKTKSIPNPFIDGYDLHNDIISYMPHLSQFHFHIRSVLENAPHIEIDTIRQSFMKQHNQFIDCTIDYFNNNYGQCQIYSLPFIGTRLDFISNRFPLFDINNTFTMVTVLLLFDDIKPFESVFFECLAQALPYLKTLEVINELEQQENITVSTNNLKFTHLTTLILFDIHINYAEQLLSRIYLPCLNELAINKDILLAIIAQDQHQTKDNCSRVERLRTSKPLSDSLNAIRNYFPSNSYVQHPKEE